MNMAWLMLLSLCSSFAITSAAGKWKLVRNENQDKLSCTQLNHGANRKPKYDDVYTTVEKCQSACLTEVPLCNAVNYIPKTSKLTAKQGRCQFEYCEKGYKYAQIKGFLSYINVDTNDNPMLPGNWMKVRDASQPKLKCDKLNEGSGQPSPKYDTEYTNVEDCKKACLTEVLGCNAVNFSPKEDPQIVKFGKCQFESCKNDYKVGGTKHYNSYIFSGYPLAKSTTTTTGLWTKLLASNKKFDCEHKNSAAGATPRYGSVYGSLEGCQIACTKEVTECNAVNYAPINVPGRAKRGKCEFQFCNFREAVPYENTASFQGYQFNGQPLRPTQPPTRPPITKKPIDYDRDGWGLAGDPREKQLDCKKLNNDANYDSQNGAKYGTKYPDGVNQCKVACEKVAGCDAINYNKDDGGTCQFQQCNGRVVRGTNAGFSSYLYRAPRTTTATRKPRTCLKKCLGGSDCEDLMTSHKNNVCTSLEKKFRDCSCVGCNCPQPWKQVANTTSIKLDCEHLNTRLGSDPFFNSKYDSLKDCQDACIQKVESCNAVNYAPATVGRSPQGTCEFHSCDRLRTQRFFGGKNFNSYIYNGPTVRPGSRTPVRRPPRGTTRAPVTGGSRLWEKKRDVSDIQFDCEHLHTSRRTSPTYNSVYDSLEKCKAACQNEVPSCNAINFAPADVRGSAIEKGTCQFQFCDQNVAFKYSGDGGFQSFIFNGVPLRDTRPPTQTTGRRATQGKTTPAYERDGWRRVGALSEFDLGCKKLNDGSNANPKYGAKYDTLDLCKKDCQNKVAGCDAVNYDKDKGCQFQQCNGVAARGTEKNFESFLMNPQNRLTTTTAAGCQSTCADKFTCDDLMAQHGTTCLDLEHTLPGCSCTGCRCHQPWEQYSNITKEKLFCEHLNTRHKDKPKFNTIYSSLKGCQDACINAVPKCNSVNYAPKTVSKRIVEGKCEFQYCDPNYELSSRGTKHFNSYVYYGPTFKPATTTTTTPAPTSPPPTTSTTYGADGWRQVASLLDLNLRCAALNAGPKHDVKNGPRYDTKYDTLDQCKAACRDKVAGCDAINYIKEKGGKCQFQQCKGVIIRGKVKGVLSFFLKPGTVTTTTIKGCKSKCIGESTCDDVIQAQSGAGVTCESLEKKPGSCDCSGCACPMIVKTSTTATTTTTARTTAAPKGTTAAPKGTTAAPKATMAAPKTTATAECKKMIDCKGKCDGATHVDACGVCGGKGSCSSYTKDDVVQKLSTILPEETHTVALYGIKPYLSLAQGIYRSKDIQRTGDSVTVYMHVIGYAKVTFLATDRLHLRNFLNAQTAVGLSDITVVDVQDARWRHSGEENPKKITSAVDITVKLDLSHIHEVDAKSSDQKTPDRSGTVVAVVVVVVIVAALLVAGVIIVYRVLDNKKQRMLDNRTLEYEMSDISPRKSNQYIQSSEPPVRRGSTSPKKATVVVTTPP